MSLKINKSEKEYKIKYIKQKLNKSQKLFDNKKNENHKSNKIFNEINNNDNFKTIDVKSENKKEIITIDLDDINFLYETIIVDIKYFIDKNKKNPKYLYSILQQIYSYINSIFFLLTKNKNNTDINNDKLKNKNILLNNKSKILYELKIEELNKKILELKQENEVLNLKDENKKGYKLNKNYGYNYLKKKVSELENKLKLNEYKYLLYIREQQNRIGNLEKELKIKEIADSNDINEIRCFPNLTKYIYNDKIKHKLIPLSESILKYNSSKKKKNINNKRKKSIKDSFLTIANSISKNQIIKNISNSKNKVKGTDYNNHTFQKLNNERNDNSIQNWQKSVDYLKQKIFKGDEEIPKYNSNTSRTNPKTNLHRYEDDDYNINNIKEGLNESIINKDKTYFISHPNLTIAGIVNRKNKFYKGLPNKNLTFKFSKNLEKNAFFKFPSTLKETLVNLEKLRINKNYKDKNDT